MRTRSLFIDHSNACRTVGSVLTHALGCSDGYVSRLKRRENGVLVNGAPAYTTRVLQYGDTLTFLTGDPPDTRRAAPVPLPLTVLWEDDDLLLIDKPAGVTVHADSRKPDEITLDHALSAYLPADAFPHPVSRLDRDTSGVMTYAKSGYMHNLLKRIQHTPDFTRAYLGVAVGVVTPASGTIELPIGFAAGSTYQRAVSTDGAPSKTVYETLSVRDGLTLLKLVPCTGRTHQLRVHMAAVGFPLAGDWLYGVRDDSLIARPALHSYALHLVHPLTGEALEQKAPLPTDMRRLFPNMDF